MIAYRTLEASANDYCGPGPLSRRQTTQVADEPVFVLLLVIPLPQTTPVDEAWRGVAVKTSASQPSRPRATRARWWC